MDKARTIAFTGHRPESLPFGENELSPACIRLKAMLLTEIMDRASQGYGIFYCGAARGSDITFGELVLLAKATEYPEIRLVCVVPHEEQAKSWSEHWRDRYYGLLKQADETVLLSTRYTSGCYHRRNRYMVDKADALISVYDGLPTGGTAYTVEYARQKGKEVVIINPDTLERSVFPPRLVSI
jgi:uncharacterized phage-like protein YoqJ